MKIKIYYNLHKKCLSVVACEGERKNRVVKFAPEIALSCCKFKVSQAGRRRVLLQRQKNIHALVHGNEIDLKDIPTDRYNSIVVKYNPYFLPYFYNVVDNTPIYDCDYVRCVGKQITAYVRKEN